MIKLFNPWLRQPNLLNKEKKIYYIKIPQADSRLVVPYKKLNIPDSVLKRLDSQSPDTNSLKTNDSSINKKKELKDSNSNKKGKK
jgi:hypothetical protein